MALFNGIWHLPLSPLSPPSLPPLQIRAEAAYLYDAVHLYARALLSVLKVGGSARNGSAIIAATKGQQYLSAMGYMVQIDENGDASGNYTLLAIDTVWQEYDNQTATVYGLVPIGMFSAIDSLRKIPVRPSSRFVLITLLSYPLCQLL